MARKEKKYHFIYKTTNILSGRYYIGMHSTDNLQDGYLGSGNRLRLAVRKHGKENFKREILEFCETREELKKREREVVTLDEISKEECMNLVIGGEGGLSTAEHVSKYQKERWKDSDYREKTLNMLKESVKRGHKNGNYKYDTFTGKKHSDETKKKMSESSKGKGIGKSNSQYGTCWVTKDDTNKKIKKEELDSHLNEGWVKGRK